MNYKVLSRGVALALAGQIFASSALAYSTVYIRRNTVVPVVFEDELNIRHNREGDRFYARVEDDRDLPRGSRIEGHIIDIQPARDKRPAYMDLEFTSIVMPDGSRESIRAVPIKLDSKAISRDRDGRMQADPQKIKSEHMVLGGLIGGLIIGGLIKKPFEGAFVGTLAGVILGEAQRRSGGNQEVIVRRGAKMGALFERDVEIRWDGYNNDRYDDRDRNDDRYDRDRNDNDGAWGQNDSDRRDDYDRDRDRYDYDNRDDYGRWNGRVSYEGRELRFSRNEEPYRLGNDTMVPLVRTAGQLGLTVDHITNSNTYFVEDDDSSLRVELDSRDYRLNGRRGTLSRSIVNRNGVVFVPLSILAALKDRPVYLNGTKVEHNAYN